MNCPHCASMATKEQTKRTRLCYRTFRCSGCKRTFNERTGTAFNYLEYPSDIVLLVVLWRLRYKLSLRDLAEMFVERGFEFTHEAVREWEARFAPLIAEHLRTRRRGQAGRSWYVDETYVNVKGKWCYLYRAIDRDGNLVDSASRFCRAFDEVRQFFRVRTTMKQHVSLAEQRAGFSQRLDALPGHGCDGLTQRRKGSEAVITILLTSVVSVLTHPTIPVEQSWLLGPTHIACQRLLPVAGISCRNPGPGSGVLALHTARLHVFSRPLSPASPPPYRPDSRRPQ